MDGAQARREHQHAVDSGTAQRRKRFVHPAGLARHERYHVLGLTVHFGNLGKRPHFDLAHRATAILVTFREVGERAHPELYGGEDDGERLEEREAADYDERALGR